MDENFSKIKVNMKVNVERFDYLPNIIVKLVGYCF